MNTPTIEFASPNGVAESCASPWSTAGKIPYQDLILKPEFLARRHKFPAGDTWFRILPALRGGRNWMMPVHALGYKGGRHTHARTLIPGGKSVFDKAFAWLKINQPQSLYSKSNISGYKLLPDPLSLCWALVQEGTKVLAKLVIASGYDGSRGAAPGIGHQIWQLSRERDEYGKLLSDPVDPECGRQICLQKSQPQGNRYPNYTLRVGRLPAPIDEIIARMDSSEIAALKPLEEVVRIMDEEEEWQLLEQVIDSALIARIRSAS